MERKSKTQEGTRRIQSIAPREKYNIVRIFENDEVVVDKFIFEDKIKYRLTVFDDNFHFLDEAFVTV